jgi:N-methylhydantoinase A
VTDASLALGYLDAETFAGGTVALDPEAALAALGAFGDRLGLSAIEAAAGIHRVVNARMADEIGLVSVRRGYDPRTFALVLLGGAGPLHGGRLAAELAIPTMLVPPTPGVLSALGLLEASVEHDRAETVAVRTADAEPAALEAAFARLEASVAERMRADRVPDGAATTSRSFEMRYAGQSYTLEVPVGPAVDGAELELAVAAFHAAHDRSYGHATPANPTEIVNVRVVQVWAPQPPGSALAGTPGRAARSRRAYFDELGGLVETPVLGRAHLQAEVVGPAIVEQPDTTLVVYPEHRAALDAAGNVVVTAPPRVASAA